MLCCWGPLLTFQRSGLARDSMGAVLKGTPRSLGRRAARSRGSSLFLRAFSYPEPKSGSSFPLHPQEPEINTNKCGSKAKISKADGALLAFKGGFANH